MGVPYDERFIATREYVNYATFSDHANNRTLQPLSSSHTDSILGTIDWKIPDNLAVKSITGYESVNTVWTIDGDGSPLPKGLTIDQQPYHQFTQEIRLNGNSFDEMLEWTVGGFYFDSRGYVAARLGGSLNWIQDDPVDNTSKAAYAHMVYHPTERMSVIGGIRYTNDEKSYQFNRLDTQDPTQPTAFPFSLIDGATGNYSGNSTDYRAAL
jgi:iron complex outermembrane receptor protein